MSLHTECSRPIAPRPEFAGILRDDTSGLDHGGRQGLAGRLDRWLDRLMLQSGLKIEASTVALLSLYCGGVLGAFLFVIGANLLWTALAAFAGFLGPTGCLLGVRRRRRSQLAVQLPDLVEHLTRAARAGRSAEECIHLAVEWTPAPLGAELELCSRKLAMGVGVDVALRELPERTGLRDLKFFVMALSAHQQTGRDLVLLLERLSRMVHDRPRLLGRLRAATMTVWAIAILMLVLPPSTVAFFHLLDPEYLGQLMIASWGGRATLAAVVLDVIGSVWVFAILRSGQCP